LTGAGRQQVLQGPKTVLDPAATLPCPDEPRRTDGSLQTHHVILICTGLLDHGDSHCPIAGTGGPQPHITHSRHLRALTPGPLTGLLHVTPLDLAPIGQFESVGTLPFYEERPLVGRRDMAHELRIAKPAIGHNHWRRQCHATSAERRHASIQHELEPVQFVAARRPGTYGVRSPDGKVDRDNQFTLAIPPTRRDPTTPGNSRVSCPLPPGPHRPNRSPFFLNPESTPTPVHCQRLRVAGLLLAAWRHSGTSTSKPKRRSRLSQERL